MRTWCLLTLTLILGPAQVWAGLPEAGADAPVLETKEWMNNRGPVSWDLLQGKLILIEKWATW